MFAPEVAVIAGDHNTNVVGAYLFDVEEKRPEDDQRRLGSAGTEF